MQNRVIIFLPLFAMLVCSRVIWGRAAGQQTPTGTPDISGMWSRSAGGGTSFVAGDGNNMKGLNPPMTPLGEEKFKAAKPSQGIRQSDHTNDTVTFQCMPPGIPRIYSEPHPVQIYQAPGSVIELFEFNHFFRVIHTDGRGHPKDVNLNPTWMGDAIGHWEGDTLVVDTVGFNGKTWIDRAGHPSSESLHLVERIRRVNQDTLQDDVTIEDPQVYTSTWKGQLQFHLEPTWNIVEDICEDQGDYSKNFANDAPTSKK